MCRPYGVSCKCWILVCSRSSCQRHHRERSPNLQSKGRRWLGNFPRGAGEAVPHQHRRGRCPLEVGQEGGVADRVRRVILSRGLRGGGVFGGGREVGPGCGASESHDWSCGARHATEVTRAGGGECWGVVIPWFVGTSRALRSWDLPGPVSAPRKLF